MFALLICREQGNKKEGTKRQDTQGPAPASATGACQDVSLALTPSLIKAWANTQGGGDNRFWSTVCHYFWLWPLQPSPSYLMPWPPISCCILHLPDSLLWPWDKILGSQGEMWLYKIPSWFLKKKKILCRYNFSATTCGTFTDIFVNSMNKKRIVIKIDGYGLTFPFQSLN